MTRGSQIGVTQVVAFLWFPIENSVSNLGGPLKLLTSFLASVGTRHQLTKFAAEPLLLMVAWSPVQRSQIKFKETPLKSCVAAAFPLCQCSLCTAVGFVSLTYCQFGVGGSWGICVESEICKIIRQLTGFGWLEVV